MRASDNSNLEVIRPNATLTCGLDGEEIETSDVTYSWIGVSKETTTNTYTVSEDDNGNTISCKMTYFDSTGTPYKGYSASLTVISDRP